MSIVVNNNISLAEKEEGVKVFDRESKITIQEVNELVGLSKTISYQDDDDEKEDEYNYGFVPSVSTDNYDSINVYGHNHM